MHNEQELGTLTEHLTLHPWYHASFTYLILPLPFSFLFFFFLQKPSYWRESRLLQSLICNEGKPRGVAPLQMRVCFNMVNVEEKI